MRFHHCPNCDVHHVREGRVLCVECSRPKPEPQWRLRDLVADALCVVCLFATLYMFLVLGDALAGRCADVEQCTADVQ